MINKITNTVGTAISVGIAVGVTPAAIGTMIVGTTFTIS